ncbi:MAG: hypothetical protein ACLTYW_11460 [Collinsella sp.]
MRPDGFDISDEELLELVTRIVHERRPDASCVVTFDRALARPSVRRAAVAHNSQFPARPRCAFCRAFQASVAMPPKFCAVSPRFCAVSPSSCALSPNSCALLLKSSSVLELELSAPPWSPDALPDEPSLCVS